MTWLGLILAAVIMYGLFRAFNRPVSDAQRPFLYTLEEPPLPRELAHVRKRVEKWKETGQLSREEYERLIALIWEDAGIPVPKPAK